MSEYGTGGASCALHPEAPALAVCDRCGAYMCNTCSDGGLKGVCPACLARTGAGDFPLDRDGWTLDALFSLAWQGFTGNAGQLIVGSLLTIGVALVLAVVRQVLTMAAGRQEAVMIAILVGGMILQYAVQGVLQLGLLDMSFDALEGQPVRLETLFWHLGKAGKLLLQYLAVIGVLMVPLALYGGLVALAATFAHGDQSGPVIAVAVIAGLAALVPLFWATLPLMFMQYELALDDDVGPIEAVRRCFTLAKGNRWAILGMSMLSGLVIMSGAILCGVGMLVTMPFGQLILGGLFLALRNGSGLPPPVRRGKRARDGVVPMPEPPGPAFAP